MRILKIPKKRKGEFRLIYAPDPAENEFLRNMVPHYTACALSVDTFGVQHGFTPGRSPVTNAAAHLGYEYTLSFDLKDFFDSVTPSHLPQSMRIPWKVTPFPDGAARQGLPTSPPLANIAASGLDADLVLLRTQSRFGYSFAYTRYADDLAFSFNAPIVGEMLRREVPRMVAWHRFKLNPAKTHMQWAGAGARHVTGVAVTRTGLRPTRSARRRLRAAQHALRTGRIGRRTLAALHRKWAQNRRRKLQRADLMTLLKRQADGLAEWCRLRLPRPLFAARPVRAAQSVPLGSQASGLSLRKPVVVSYARRFNLPPSSPAQ